MGREGDIHVLEDVIAFDVHVEALDDQCVGWICLLHNRLAVVPGQPASDSSAPEAQEQHDDGQHRAGEGRHPRRVAQALGQVVHLVHRHDHGDPREHDQADIEHAAGGAERLAAGELVLEAMLIERLRQQDQRQREREVDAALGHIVVESAEARPDVEQGHAEGENRGGLDENVALAVLQSFRRGELAVERGYVDLLDLAFFLFVCHTLISFPSTGTLADSGVKVTAVGAGSSTMTTGSSGLQLQIARARTAKARQESTFLIINHINGFRREGQPPPE